MNRFFLFLFLFSSSVSFAQKLKKDDKIIIADLKENISFLADDKLEGRRTGTPSEKLAYTYLSEKFKMYNLIPEGDTNSYIQEFKIIEGRQIDSSTHLIINGNDLAIEKDFFPLIFSSDTSFESTPTIAFQEKGMPWFWDLKEVIEHNKNNPHFDLAEEIKTKALDAASKGASAFIIYNTSENADDLKFEGTQKTPSLIIPVVYVTKAAREKYMADESTPLDLNLKISLSEKSRYGHNVIGYINNNAANTIIIGAHYDHLGYGEDHNSLWTGAPQIHNGADDNASGTAAVIELAKMLKRSGLKNNNYLFICFSGEELGLYGSKYFTEHSFQSLAAVDYMINMDMVGRLNDNTHALTIGGIGTSASWAGILSDNDKNLVLKFDSSGVGPSDHTSFYRKDIPVLFFFTGIHSDYHKPTDDVDKINFTGELYILKFIYNIIKETNRQGKLVFQKTKEKQMDGARFTVSLGIMPDYSFSGSGVKADGIIDGKIAQKAGIKAGDIIIQLGDHKFSDIYSYMDALGKFKKGDAAAVKVLRGKEELIFDIIF